MVRIQPVKKMAGYNLSLYDEVRSLRVPVEQVKKLYGSLGVDIFEGRKPTILSEEDIKLSKKIINRIKAWWLGMGKYDYEIGDRLSDVILKYALNKHAGKVDEIRELFGESGVSELNVLSSLGYIEI